MKVIFEYRCDEGDHVIEQMHELGEAPEQAYCEQCSTPVCCDADCCNCCCESAVYADRLPSRGNFATFAGSHRAEYGRG